MIFFAYSNYKSFVTNFANKTAIFLCKIPPEIWINLRDRNPAAVLPAARRGPETNSGRQ